MGEICWEMGRLLYYIQDFLEIPHDALLEKNTDVFVFLLVTNMWYKIIA